MAINGLKTAYGIETPQKAREFYAKWASEYDAELSQNGYVTPERCAKALSKFEHDKTVPILDVGCGTGMSGMALAREGFTTIDGSDLTQEMLDIAKTRDGLYRHLWLADINDPFPFVIGTYAHITAMGVIARGYAPAETISLLLTKVPEGGTLVFSLNDHTLEDPSFSAQVDTNLANGVADLAFKEYGHHIPGIDLKSTVYVLRKR